MENQYLYLHTRSTYGIRPMRKRYTRQVGQEAGSLHFSQIGMRLVF